MSGFTAQHAMPRGFRGKWWFIIKNRVLIRILGSQILFACPINKYFILYVINYIKQILKKNRRRVDVGNLVKRHSVSPPIFETLRVKWQNSNQPNSIKIIYFRVRIEPQIVAFTFGH